MADTHLNQQGRHFRHMFGKVIVSGMIECKSGIHIGGVSDTIEIGGIDKPVIRNPVTHEPYIPGSSLKGKLRSIVEKIALDDNDAPLVANKKGDDKNRIYRHECESFGAAKKCPLCRVFGAVSKEGDNFPSPLRPRDCNLANPEFLEDDGILVFEAKTENALDRLTSAASPRTMERVPAGAKFSFEIVFNIEMLDELSETNSGDMLKSYTFPYLQDDMTHIFAAMSIIEKDGLGGHISRGYGAVEFRISQLQAIDVRGNVIASVDTKSGEEHKIAGKLEEKDIKDLADTIKKHFSTDK